MKIFITGILSILIYLPIFIFMLSRNFRKKFNKINSQKKIDLAIETLVGILYFLIILFSSFSEIKNGVPFYIGLIIYFTGLILTYRGYYLFYFEKGLITKDVFMLSRNPTYFFGFISILGIIIMTKSLIVFELFILTMILTHRIILNEEKYLEKKFGKKYLSYKNNVQRYF